jgi:fucose permease
VKRNYFIVGLILIIFFVISILTTILGPLIPDFIDGFSLSLTLAAFMPFAFFIAYGVMSIPSGMLVDRYQEKPVMLAAFMLAFAGSLLFALFPHFWVGLVSLFLIGSGMAMLQVAINPLLRTAGGEENFAFFSVMAQLIFGGAAYIAPQIYTYLVINIDSVTAESDFVVRALSPVVP